MCRYLVLFFSALVSSLSFGDGCINDLMKIMSHQSNLTTMIRQVHDSFGARGIKNQKRLLNYVKSLESEEGELRRKFNALSSKDRDILFRVILKPIDSWNGARAAGIEQFFKNHPWAKDMSVLFQRVWILDRSIRELFKALGSDETLYATSIFKSPMRNIILGGRLKAGAILSVLNPFAPVVKYLNPAPRGVRSLLQRQFRNPNIKFNQLTSLEQRRLNRWGLKEIYERRGEYLLEINQSWRRFRVGATMLKDFALAASSAMAAITLFNQLEVEDGSIKGTKVIGIDEYLKKNVDELEVHILVNQIPFPHLSMRIGSKVYSFGFEKMKESTVNQYFSFDLQVANRAQANEIKLPNQNDTNQQINNQILNEQGYDGNFFTGMFKFLPNILKNQPNSQYVIELNLAPSEVRVLRQKISALNEFTYRNWTGVNDCATMVSRMLNEHTELKIPYLIDASPNQIVMDLSRRYLMGDPLVKNIYTMATVHEDKPFYHLTRNSMITYFESRMFIDLFLPLRTSRVFLDATTSERELVQLDEDTKEAMLREAQEFVKNDLESELDYVYLVFVQDDNEELIQNSREKYINELKVLRTTIDDENVNFNRRIRAAARYSMIASALNIKEGQDELDRFIEGWETASDYYLN